MAILFTGSLWPVLFDRQLGFTLVLIIITFYSLVFPVVGGVIGLVIINLVYIGNTLFDKMYSYINTMTLLFIVGSMLSIIDGIARWRWRRKHSKFAEKTSLNSGGIKDEA